MGRGAGTTLYIYICIHSYVDKLCDDAQDEREKCERILGEDVGRREIDNSNGRE